MNHLNIIIANDIETRATEVESFLKDTYQDIKVVKRFSYKDTLKEILTRNFDLLILDITMPTYFNKEMFSPQSGTIRSLAGINILERMFIERLFVNTVLFTGLETFYDKHNHQLTIDDIINDVKKFPFYKGVIRDNGERTMWQNELIKYIENIKE